jgi:gamma-glutamylcyclotransferase (GGCT)/AIG2-like uncharacterized protein YtfP
MTSEEKETEHLFSYGTLQEEAVQLATFNRRLAGQPDALDGYRLALIPIQNQNVVARSSATHYRNAQFTGNAADCIEGTVFRVTQQELEQADVYEAPADYQRVLVQLRSGRKAWVYWNVSP